MTDNQETSQKLNTKVAGETGELTEEKIEAEIKAFYPIKKDGLQSKRLSDGNGLFLQLTKYGKYFKHQGSLQGRVVYTALGSYPRISLEQARKKAKRCSAKIQGKRSELQSERILQNIEELVSRARGNSCPFANLERLTRFSMLLMSKIESGDIAMEDGVALMLALLIPAAPADIFSAKRIRLDSNVTKWQIEPAHRASETQKREPKSRLVHIPKAALQILRAWTTGEPSIELFPVLAQEKARARTHRLNRVLYDFWPYERIKIDDFRHCFRAMAKEYSYFKPQLIEEALNGEDKIDSIDNPGYDHQRWALADWWAKVLGLYDLSGSFQNFRAWLERSNREPKRREII